jgi:hypothetical protein
MYYLYSHSTLDNKVFYIGKGTKDTYHVKGFNRAYLKSGRSKEWRDKSKNGYTVNILEESENEENILDRELQLIQECEDCVNKISRKTSVDYKLIKLTEEICLMRINAIRENAYIILSDGKIFNLSGLELKPLDNGKGYKVIKINIKNSNSTRVLKSFYIHRLVAEAFIENPENKKVVNHKDLNRSNNTKKNLEWCTHKENTKYAVDKGSFNNLKTKKAVLQLDYDGNVITEYEQVKIASKLLQCTQELIQQAASLNNLNSLSAKGFLWIYKKDYNDKNVELKKNLINTKKLKKKHGIN